MSITLTMPRLSDTMEQGTIIKWNVKEGDEVASGAVVADVETDKATMEMQVYDDGVVARILVGEGDQVPVGTAIALIAEEGEDPSAVDSGGTTPPANEAPVEAPRPWRAAGVQAPRARRRSRDQRSARCTINDLRVRDTRPRDPDTPARALRARVDSRAAGPS